MTIINTNPDRIIQLGYEGEDRVTVLRFRYGADWLENGEGIFNIRVRRHGEHTAYNAQLVTEDPEYNCLLMTVTNTELSIKGAGEMQVVYSGADFVKKSPIYSYNVSRAVDEVSDPPAEDVYTQIIESLSDLQMDVQGLSDAVEDIGDISLLTTMSKTDLVSAINEVNEHSGGGSVTVDSALSDTSENPVRNKTITGAIREVSGYAHDLSGVIDGLGEDVEGLEIAIQGKADIQTVSALADAVNGLDGDIQGLQASKADTSTVTALSGTVSGLQTAVQSKADTQTVTALSGTVSGLQTTKADKSYVDTQLTDKASAQTVSDLSDDVSDLQTGLAGKVGDVQINGTSVVTNGVANVPVASGSVFGVVKTNSNNGIFTANGGVLTINNASESEIKTGTNESKPLTSHREHMATFYGLAKVAGHDEKNSNLPVGTYSEEAKIAIQKMLGIYEAPWELIREDTFTNAEEADHIITTDANGDAFELTDLVFAFWLPKQSTPAKKGSYGHVKFMKNGVEMVRTESGAWEQQANANARGFMTSIEDHNGMVFVRQHTNVSAGYTANTTMRIPQNFDMTSAQPSIKFAGSDFYIDSINIIAVTGTGQYRLYGKRKWT